MGGGEQMNEPAHASVPRPSAGPSSTGAARDLAYCAIGLAAVSVTAVTVTAPFGGLRKLAEAPILYTRDAVWHAAIIKQAIEGNPLAGDRLGYPFGANWLDWPTLDWGMMGIARALGFLTHDYALIFNLLFLLGFPAAFLSAYLVSRAFGLRPAFAFVAGLSFSLASYHFERLSLHGHLFLTWYWVAPVYFLLGWRIAHPVQAGRRSHQLLQALGLIALTGFGVYYCAFGLIGLTAALGYALTSRPARAAFRSYAQVVVPLGIGVALQVLPTVLHRLQSGANPLAFSRSSLEAETWALRPVQLLLPHITHRVPLLADKAQEFYAVAVPGNENVMSSVGVIATLGLWVLLQLAVTAIAGKELDERFRYLMVLTTTFLAFATIGGLGLLLSLLGITEIRSWNRLSIYIGFAGILATLLALTPTADRYGTRIRRLATPLVLTAVLGLVWIDQTPAPSTTTLGQAQEQRAVTARFVHELEARLPQGAAIYQLPFTGYPEGWRLRTYDAYEFMKPYLESDHLRFNLGGMKGREGDRFYRALAQRSVETQIRVIRQLGFSGIYVDRMGLVDYGTALIADLERELGSSAATYRSDRRVVYFDLGNAHPALPAGSITPAQAAVLTDFEPSFPKRHLSD